MCRKAKKENPPIWKPRKDIKPVSFFFRRYDETGTSFEAYPAFTSSIFFSSSMPKLRSMEIMNINNFFSLTFTLRCEWLDWMTDKHSHKLRCFLPKIMRNCKVRDVMRQINQIKWRKLPHIVDLFDDKLMLMRAIKSFSAPTANPFNLSISRRQSA